MALTQAEKLGEERRLIFENYANGVDVEDLKTAFKRSAAEIQKEIFFVAKKIKEYRFRRCVDASQHAAPPVACDTLLDIRVNRFALFETLRKIGNLTLSSELLLPKIIVQNVRDKKDMREVAHRLRA